MSAVPRSHLVRFAQLAALWAYAVGQPVLSYMEANDELLVFSDTTRAQLAGFAVLLLVGPPLAAVLYAAAAGFLSRWVGDMMFVALLAAFLIPVASQLTKRFEPDRVVALAMILALTALAVACYLRWRAVRLFVAVAAILPVLSVAWFLHSLPGPLRADTAAAATRPSPQGTVVVAVVVDELPLSTLLTRTGKIDAVRYPAFARLAREGTWYPRATTVYSHTARAVPAILTGRTAKAGGIPTVETYPRNLFTLLGSTRALFVHESRTRLCPPSLCPRPRLDFIGAVDQIVRDVRLPYVLDVVPASLAGTERGASAINPAFWRASKSAVHDYDRFVGELDGATPGGSVHFVHLLLPHAPWRYLPSGRRFASPHNDAKDIDGVWVDSPWRVQQGFQRHVLQVEYVDRLLGRLLRRLERAGLYDRALVVVVADHGASFRAGMPRRRATPATFADIASIPLFVKYPGEKRGVVDQRAARTVDIVPTIADVLGVAVPWRVEGASLRGAAPHRTEALVGSPLGIVLRRPLRVIARQNEQTVRRRVRLLGEGHDPLFRLGVHQELLGRAVGGPWPASPTVRVRLDHRGDLLHVRKASGVVPAFVEGLVTDGTVPDGVELAVAVNGRVLALTRCFLDRGEQRFQALVPESALRDGPNRLDVYAIEADGSRLLYLGGTGS